MSCVFVLFLGSVNTQSFAEKVSVLNDTNFEESLEIADVNLHSESRIFISNSFELQQYSSEYSFSGIVPILFSISNTQVLCAEKVCESIFIKNQFLKLALSNEVMCLV